MTQLTTPLPPESPPESPPDSSPDLPPDAAGKAVEGLTRRQHDVLRNIVAFIRRRGYAPTYREIGTALGISPATVHSHVLRLREAGLILRTSRRKHAMVVASAAAVRQDIAMSEDGTPLASCPTCGVELRPDTSPTDPRNRSTP